MRIGLLAIFRNESHAIAEFIEHYLWQGVDHFYLINNASEDDYLTAIEPYRDVISLYQEDHVSDTEYLCGGGKQIEAYNRVLPDIDTDWLILHDLDEFSYARDGYENIKQFIEIKGHRFDQYLMQLKPFTSGGLVNQPESIRKGFTQGRIKMKGVLTKPIVKTDLIDRVYINYCTLNKDAVTVNGDISYSSNDFSSGKPEVEKVLPYRALDIGKQFSQHPIKCNHYSVQSKDWYFKVKAKRGTATWHGGEYMPAEKWFKKRWDELHSVITETDTELADLQG